MRFVVVGAGVVGSCLAYELARAGERVVLADSGVPGGGASAASYAWVNSNNFDDPRYHALRVLGMPAYRELARVLGAGEWLHATGCLRVAATDVDGKELRERVARKRAAGYPAELLDTGQAAAAEPALARLPREPSAIASFPAEGYVDTTTLIGCLLAEFEGLGGVLMRARVTGLREGGTGVRTTGGDLAADRVIVCTGSDTGLLRDAGFDLAARGPAGATVITVPVPVRMRGLVHFPGVTVRPDGGGRLLLHAVDIDERLDPEGRELDPGAVGDLTGRAGTWLGLGRRDLEVAEIRVSVRPHPPDGFPVVGPVPGAPGAYVVCTHSGVTLAAVLARLVAAEVRSGEADPLLDAYRPGRFTRLPASGGPGLDGRPHGDRGGDRAGRSGRLGQGGAVGLVLDDDHGAARAGLDGPVDAGGVGVGARPPGHARFGGEVSDRSDSAEHSSLLRRARSALRTAMRGLIVPRMARWAGVGASAAGGAYRVD